MLVKNAHYSNAYYVPSIKINYLDKSITIYIVIRYIIYTVNGRAWLREQLNKFKKNPKPSRRPDLSILCNPKMFARSKRAIYSYSINIGTVRLIKTNEKLHEFEPAD